MRRYLLNETCGLFKTNPRLTGNVKIVVESSKDFFITQLDYENNYIKYSLQNDFAQNVSSFLRNYVNNKYAIHNFDISNNNNIKSDYLQQYDLMYQYGAKYSRYSNKLRFFAPLSFTKNDIPKFFVIAARKKREFTQSTLHESMKFDIVKSFDLHNGYFKNIIDSVVLNKEYTDEHLQYNNSTIVANGINISNGMMSSAKVGISKMQYDEYSITEANNVFTNIFKDNNLIVSNIINFEFEFELAEAGLYDIVGFYTNDINHININDSNEPTSIYNANKVLIDNTMTLVKSYNNANKTYELHQFNINNAYDNQSLKLLRKVTSPYATLITRQLNSFFEAIALKSIAIGDRLTIVEDDIQYDMFCHESLNSNKFFKYSDNINEQIENIIDCISRQNTKALYSINFDKASMTLTIEAIYNEELSFYVDIPDAWQAISYNAKFVSAQQTNTKYSFVKPINVDSTIAIQNVSYTLSGIDYNNINYCKVIINGQQKSLTLNSIFVDSKTNIMYISFNESIELDDSLKQNILLELYQIEFLQVCQMQFYDVCTFDVDFVNSKYSNKHNVITNLQLFKIYNDSYATEYDKILNEYKNIDDKPCVLAANDTLQYSTNDFDRLKEYDVSAYATFNKINTGINKWSSIHGFNAYRKPLSMNMSIVYGQSNLSPVFDSKDYHNVHSLAFDYFVIGVQTQNVNEDNYFEHTAETIENIDDLSEPGALNRFFTHIIEYQTIDSTYYQSFDIFSKIHKQDKVAKTIFNGVEYVFSEYYDNWSFAIVHVNSTENEVFNVVVNNHDKAIFVAICKHIDNNILTSNFAANEFILKRFVYYMNFADTINNTLNDRFYDISFYEFCKFLETNDTYMHYTLPTNIIINTNLAAYNNNLSADIITTDVNAYAIQKYALKLKPTMYSIVHAYDIAGISKVMLNDANYIVDYGIFKVGDANTLTTDDINSTTKPIHYLNGETVYHLIEYLPTQQTQLFRYYNQKSNYKVSKDNLLYNHANLLSILPVVNIFELIVNVVNSDSTTINVFNLLVAKLSTMYQHKQNIAEYAKLLLTIYAIDLKCYYKSTQNLAMLLNSTTNIDLLNDNILQFSEVSSYTCVISFATKQ
jgi:hypothetical protein